MIVEASDSELDDDSAKAPVGSNADHACCHMSVRVSSERATRVRNMSIHYKLCVAQKMICDILSV